MHFYLIMIIRQNDYFKMNLSLKKDVLIAGIVSILIVVILNILLMIAVLSLLSDYFSSDSLYSVLKVVLLISLAIPPYVAARVVDSQVLLHAGLVGLLEALLLVFLMTQTFSWDGTLQDEVLMRMPVVIGVVLLLSFIAGFIAKKVNRQERTRQTPS